MLTPFATFRSALAASAPKAAIVLGSGLGRVVDRLAVTAEVSFTEVPDFAAPTVHGHSGRVLAGTWDGIPVLVFQGRMHYYEGHSWERVCAPVRLAAELGITRLILTNAAGGIREDLNPGDLMAIRNHIPLLDQNDWRVLANRGDNFLSEPPYSAPLIAQMKELPVGTYAALTGPCYETPTEIRALAVIGADAVGMSTAKEAETAAALGLSVAGISCITNKAAGLGAGPLDHTDVLRTAAAPADRLANIISRLIVA
jgi:purine-nucleoside phosphorylase